MWTRKRVARVRGSFGELAGIVDESAGYHARHTAWRWSAGVGTLVSGEPVAWNLVDGIHDAPEASERTVWVAGEPHEVGPVAFADDLSRRRRPGCGSLPRPRARGARTTSSSAPTTSSRSAPSRALSPARASCAKAGA